MELHDAIRLLFNQLQRGLTIQPQPVQMPRQQAQAQDPPSQMQRQYDAALDRAMQEREALQQRQQQAQLQAQQQAQFQLQLQAQNWQQQQAQTVTQYQYRYPAQNEGARQYGGYVGGGGYHNPQVWYQSVYYPHAPVHQQMNYLAHSVQYPQTQQAANGASNSGNTAARSAQVYRPHQQTQAGADYGDWPAPQYNPGQYPQQSGGFSYNLRPVPMHYNFNANSYPAYNGGVQPNAQPLQYMHGGGQAVPGAHGGYGSQYGQCHQQQAGQGREQSAPTSAASVPARNSNSIRQNELDARRAATAAPMASAPVPTRNPNGLAQNEIRPCHTAIAPKLSNRQKEMEAAKAAVIVNANRIARLPSSNLANPAPQVPGRQAGIQVARVGGAVQFSERDRPFQFVGAEERNHRIVDWLKTRPVPSRRRNRSCSPSSPCPPSKRIKKEPESSSAVSEHTVIKRDSESPSPVDSKLNFPSSPPSA